MHACYFLGHLPPHLSRCSHSKQAAPGRLLQLRAKSPRAAWAYGVFRSRYSLRLPCSPKRFGLRGFRAGPGAKKKE